MLSKSYNPKETEGKWRDHWEEKGVFKADPHSEKPSFSLIMPPPNVTGVLHMGHALVNTLQDVITRWKRMSGFEVLWIPGLDHAGISTQTVVERHLIKTQNKRRSDFSRDTFLRHVLAWKEKSATTILHQLRQLGCSCDWSRMRFTMDPEASHTVRHVFKKMFTDGLIYRDNYLVNWDPLSQTALADDEVEYEERKGFLWYFRYPVVGEKPLIVATTRPETLLGDTAVAVSPKDKRYQHLASKQVRLPLSNRQIPIILDSYVDPKFGSGVVKITPAHDFNDYVVGLKHGLAMINIMTPDGKINEKGGEFEGMTMLEARSAVVKKMELLDLVEKIEPYVHRVGVSYRSKAVIEPYLSKQWFVKATKFKHYLKETVKNSVIKIVPPHFESTYFHWIDNLKDWCISRQLWWGHRIPIWYHENGHDILCYAEEGVPEQVQKAPEKWKQDPDVLDTWFSSALWPFSTLNWPNSQDFHKFYPQSTLITGHDILFFWVARMILMGEYVTGNPPFKEVFLHGLIYGKSYWREERGQVLYASKEEKTAFDLGKVPKDVHSKWEKMSKSKGNVIDPLEIIDLYGTDALRMALCFSTTLSRQIDLDRRCFEEFKNFANKIWNGSRFLLLNLDIEEEELLRGIDPNLLKLEDKWLLSRLNQTIYDINACLEQYKFDKLAKAGYHFFWNELCAYYLEITKPVLFDKTDKELRRNKQRLLFIACLCSLLLLHPIAPFITEEVFSHIKARFKLSNFESKDPYTAFIIKVLQADVMATAPYPTVFDKNAISAGAEAAFAKIQEMVVAIRNLRAEMQIPPSTASILEVRGSDANFIKKNQAILSALVPIADIRFTDKPSPLSSTAIGEGYELTLALPKSLLGQEKSRLQKLLGKLENQMQKLEKQLGNPEFIKNAPSDLVDQAKGNKKVAEKQIEQVREKLRAID